jgi:hypothetical protein
MTSFSSTPRPAFVYNSADDTWYEISAKADTASGYEWGGDHKFLASIIGQHGINNFLNPTARDAAITSPIRGAFCFIRQDGNGINVDEFQIYDGIRWTTPLTDHNIINIMGAQ